MDVILSVEEIALSVSKSNPLFYLPLQTGAHVLKDNGTFLIAVEVTYKVFFNTSDHHLN